MPNNKILLITADYYKRNSVVNLNVDEELIHPQIIKAQNMNIERVLGSNLFNTLLEQVSLSNVEPRMVTLLEDYIQPALVEWVTYTALPYFNFKITNKSVAKKSSDNSTPSELNEVNFLRQDIRDDAEYLSDRLTKYLQASLDVFPEYDTNNSDYDDIKPVKNNFFSGIYLSNNNNNTNNDDECCD
ncbi:MAG: hypothetical protein Unbinned706contig1001_20 [Prokaryotic dsDNA virus sp.]|nr:MAG: hypothetical protein Unbinned706contig1001_20 [Prokaryotic dsDNA virus sp.]|tara:strand:- start:17899 stop:18456 length:558 start_codon:yes stop_codon:yes gene_type:complete